MTNTRFVVYSENCKFPSRSHTFKHACILAVMFKEYGEKNIKIKVAK